MAAIVFVVLQLCIIAVESLKVTWFSSGRYDRSEEVLVVTYVNYERHPEDHPKAHELERLRQSSPFDIAVLSLDAEWKGSIDKLLAYAEYVSRQPEEKLILLLDAFDVIFAPQAAPEIVIATYRSFKREIVLATEENAYPVEIAEAAEWLAAEVFGLKPRMRYPSRYLNAGGILGTAKALSTIYGNILQGLRSRQDADALMAKADRMGHWFLHAYDQFEICRFLLRQNETVASWIALDVNQKLFGSTMLVRMNRPMLVPLLNSTARPASIDINAGVEFNAPLEAFAFDGCAARFRDRAASPLLWHGHGPEKGAYLTLLEEFERRRCYYA